MTQIQPSNIKDIYFKKTGTLSQSRIISSLELCPQYGFTALTLSNTLHLISTEQLIKCQGSTDDGLINTGLSAHLVKIHGDYLALANNELVSVYKIPDLSQPIGTIAVQSKVSGIQFNPADSKMIAVLAQDGSLRLGKIVEKSVEIFAFNGQPITSMCFSPKGKQLVVGHMNGSLSQLKLDLSIAKKIPGPPGSGKPNSILWVSTSQFLVFMVDGDSCSLVQIDTQKAPAPPLYNDVGDIFVSDTVEPQSQAYFITLCTEHIVCSSGTSSEVVVLSKEGTHWGVYFIEEDSRRASLPADQFSVGGILYTGYNSPVIFDELEIYPPMPVYVVAGKGGTIHSFSLISKYIFGDHPPVTSTPFNISLFKLSKAQEAQKELPKFDLKPQPQFSSSSNLFAPPSKTPVSTGGSVPAFAFSPVSSSSSFFQPLSNSTPSKPTETSCGDTKPRPIAFGLNLATGSTTPKIGQFGDAAKGSASAFSFQQPQAPTSKTQAPAPSPQGKPASILSKDQPTQIIREPQSKAEVSEFSDSLLKQFSALQTRILRLKGLKEAYNKNFNKEIEEVSSIFQTDILAQLNQMEDYLDRAAKLVESRRKQILELKENNLEHFSQIHYAKMIDERNKDPKYLSLARAQHMDISTVRRFKSLEQKMTFLRNQIGECRKHFYYQRYPDLSPVASIKFIRHTLANQAFLIQKLRNEYNGIREKLGALTLNSPLDELTAGIQKTSINDPDLTFKAKNVTHLKSFLSKMTTVKLKDEESELLQGLKVTASPTLSITPLASIKSMPIPITVAPTLSSTPIRFQNVSSPVINTSTTSSFKFDTSQVTTPKTSTVPNFVAPSFVTKTNAPPISTSNTNMFNTLSNLPTISTKSTAASNMFGTTPIQSQAAKTTPAFTIFGSTPGTAPTKTTSGSPIAFGATTSNLSMNMFGPTPVQNQTAKTTPSSTMFGSTEGTSSTKTTSESSIAFGATTSKSTLPFSQLTACSPASILGGGTASPQSGTAANIFGAGSVTPQSGTAASIFGAGVVKPQVGAKTTTASTFGGIGATGTPAPTNILSGGSVSQQAAGDGSIFGSPTSAKANVPRPPSSTSNTNIFNTPSNLASIDTKSTPAPNTFGTAPIQSQASPASSMFGSTAGTSPTKTTSESPIAFGASISNLSTLSFSQQTPAASSPASILGEGTATPQSGTALSSIGTGAVTSQAGATTTTASIFGGGSVSQQPAGGGSIFGSPTSAKTNVPPVSISNTNIFSTPSNLATIGNKSSLAPNTIGTTPIQSQAAKATPEPSMFGSTATKATSGNPIAFGSTISNLSTLSFSQQTPTASSPASIFGGGTGTPQSGTAATIFGAGVATPQPGTPASIFGAGAATPQPGTAASIFGAGAATPQPGTAASIFGAGVVTTQSGTAASIFGAGVATPQPGANTTSSSIFGGGGIGASGTPTNIFGGGSVSQQPAGSGSIFGSPTSPFGSKSAHPSFGSSAVFGSTPLNTFNTSPTSQVFGSGGSVFGGGGSSLPSFSQAATNSPPANIFGGGTPSSPFGQAATGAASPGIFGGGTGFGGFGQGGNISSPAFGSGSTFGANTNQPTGFGQLAQSPQQPSAFGSFSPAPQGQQQQQQQSSPSFGGGSAFTSWR